MEALRVEGGQKNLQAHKIFELEVKHRGLAVAELLDEFLKARADPLPRQHVVLLDAALHALWQKALVAEKKGHGDGYVKDTKWRNKT